jgi:hypothetical protein
MKNLIASNRCFKHLWRLVNNFTLQTIGLISKTN